jgi:hypothetical protein
VYKAYIKPAITIHIYRIKLFKEYAVDGRCGLSGNMPALQAVQTPVPPKKLFLYLFICIYTVWATSPPR